MIRQYKMWVKPEKDEIIRPEWAYRLYAAMLAEASKEFQKYVHQPERGTPVSQFLSRRGERILWTVNLLGDLASQELGQVMEEKRCYEMDGRQTFQMELQSFRKIEDFEELMQPEKQKHRLEFCTVTAFKSQGRYVNIPTVPLVMKSLIRQWNACFTDGWIEDEDGCGIDEMISHIECTHYRLQDHYYHIKRNTIRGFAGYMELENGNQGFHRELSNALFAFSEYAGVGIKTALGMGGIKYR